MSTMGLLPEWAVKKALNTFGPDAAEKIRANPYIMHQLGVKMEILDRLAASMGIPAQDNVHRAIAVAESELDRELLNGNCYMLVHTLAVKARCKPEELALDGTIHIDGKYAMLRRAREAEIFVAAWMNDAL